MQKMSLGSAKRTISDLEKLIEFIKLGKDRDTITYQYYESGKFIMNNFSYHEEKESKRKSG